MYVSVGRFPEGTHGLFGGFMKRRNWSVSGIPPVQSALSDKSPIAAWGISRIALSGSDSLPKLYELNILFGGRGW